MTENKKGYLVVEEAQQILFRLQTLGINGFYFICIPWGGHDPEDPSTKVKGRKLLHPRHLATKIVSDANIWSFSEHYISQIAKYDLTYNVGHEDNTPGQVHLWYQDKVDLSKQQMLMQLMDKYQYRSRLSFFRWVHNHDNWHAGIFLCSQLSEQEVEAKIEQHREQLVPALNTIVDHLYRKYIKVINPFSNYGILSAQCIRVLEHLANGLQTDEIALEMDISAAGVNYHINQARKLLGGMNRTHLLSRAHRLGII